jgi:hypothetical protein
MKRIVLLVAFIAVLAVPAFSQFRVDLGFDIPLALGVLGNGEIQTSHEAGEFLRDHILPFPEASLYYQFELGPLKLAPGVRIFTIILESVLWPNLMAELAFDPVFIQAQLGGLGLGKERRFRIGGGVIGLILPDLTTEGIGIAPYVGAKISLLF